MRLGKTVFSYDKKIAAFYLIMPGAFVYAYQMLRFSVTISSSGPYFCVIVFVFYRAPLCQ